MLVGNLVAILASALVCVVVSLIKPDRYDWKSTREISMVDDAETGALRLLLISHLLTSVRKAARALALLFAALHTLCGAGHAMESTAAGLAY